MMRLVCLGAGPESVPFLQRLAAARLAELVIVDANPDAPGLDYGRAVLASCYHVEPTVTALTRLGLRFDGVLCCGVDAPHVAAAVAQAFDLPGLRPPAAALSVDKRAQIECLDAAGLAVPGFGFSEPSDRSRAILETVIKPLDSRGARGVQRVKAGEPPAPAWRAALASSPTGRAMWEEWLDGPQYSTESVIYRGRVVWTGIGRRNYARLEQFAPAVIEDGYDWERSEGPGGAVSQVIGQACAVLGWDNCTVKGDLVLHGGRYVIIELAARLAGGYFAEPGHRLACGVDLTRTAALLALGAPVEDPRPWMYQQPVSQRYIFGQPGRIIRRLPIGPFDSESDQAARLVGTCLRWHKGPGHQVRAAQSHADRLGMVMCWGPAAELRAVGSVDYLEGQIEYE